MTTRASAYTPSRPGRQRPRVAAPRVWGVRAADVVWVLVLNAVLITGMWVRHGGAGSLHSASAVLTAAGQLTALLGTYGALIQVVLMSRSPWLEQLFGLDGLAHLHRLLGFTTISLICGHVVLSTAGYALGDGSSFMGEMWALLTTYPYVLMAGVATLLLIGVGVTSLRAIRRRLDWETWHFIHLYTYLAIALAFGHELATGTDFSSDHLAQAYWCALYAVVIALVAVFRIWHPLRLSRRHALRVESVVKEGPGVVSIYVTGRDLDQLPVRAGQYFRWRFLAGDGWWRAHPFSLSAAPNGDYLRLTVKDVGSGSRSVHALAPGTRVAIEGPYGLFTSMRRTRPRTLLIAAGIGITPIRALFEELPAGRGKNVVLYRARSWGSVIFRTELEDLARERQADLHLLVGRRGRNRSEDPLSPRAIGQLVPDARDRDVFICGPPSLMRHVHESLAKLGVPDEQIHYERFALL